MTHAAAAFAALRLQILGQDFPSVQEPDNLEAMAHKRRYSSVIMVMAAIVVIALSLSYYGVHHYASRDGSRDGEESVLTQSTTETGNSSSKPMDQASDSSSALSAKDQDKKDAEALQEQQESWEDEATEGELDELAISGAVLDDAGEPIPGATVVAEAVKSSSRENSAPPAPIDRQSKTTDRLGTFEFRNLTEGEYDLTASKGEDFFPATLKVRAGLANAELILQRFRTVRVYGKVTDDFGAPLEEVKVRTLGTQFDVKSAGDGSYEILTAPMRAGSPPVLEFSREGFEETRRRIEDALSQDREEVQLDVQMEPDSDQPKVAVAGQVRGPLGEAVVGVNVRLKSFKASKGYSTRTDDSGEFNFPMVETGEGYRLDVTASEDYEAYQSEVFALVSQDAFFEIELDSAKFSSLSGTVTDLTGRPLSGFQLWLRGIGTSAQSPLPVQTDAAGRFRLEQLRAGEVRLESRSQPMLSASNIVLEPGGHKEVEIPLDWGADWLLGQVVDLQGEPVSGASIIVRWKEMFGAVLSESRRDLRSDLGGYFTASNLGAESYSLTVQAPGYQSFQGQHQLGGGEGEVQIELPTSGAPGGTGGGGG